MKLKVGEFYICRNGQIIGPMYHLEKVSGVIKFFCNGHWYHDDGRVVADHQKYDIIK